MKAKYLVQVQTNNANMGATGWFTVNGAMTLKAAKDFEHDIIEAEQYANRDRAVRVIKQQDFSREVKEWNRKALEQDRKVSLSVNI